MFHHYLLVDETQLCVLRTSDRFNISSVHRTVAHRGQNRSRKRGQSDPTDIVSLLEVVPSILLFLLCASHVVVLVHD